MSELLLAYSNLEQRLVQALEFTQFADMVAELEREAQETEALIEKIAIYAYITGEDDYYGAFVTIKGEYRDWPDYLPDYEPENLVEETCIKAIATLFFSSFVSEIIYTSTEIHKTELHKPSQQEEMTIWVKDIFAYGVLKQLDGHYLLFGKQRVVTLHLEVSPVLPQSMPSSDWVNCCIKVLRRVWFHNQTMDNIVEIQHIPSKIKACATGEKSQLVNKINAAKLLQSRMYQASKVSVQEKAQYHYVWGEKVIIDHSCKQKYSFSEAKEISKLLIKALETIPGFAEE